MRRFERKCWSLPELRSTSIPRHDQWNWEPFLPEAEVEAEEEKAMAVRLTGSATTATNLVTCGLSAEPDWLKKLLQTVLKTRARKVRKGEPRVVTRATPATTVTGKVTKKHSAGRSRRTRNLAGHWQRLHKPRSQSQSHNHQCQSEHCN